MKTSTKNLALLSVTVAIAMILSFIESRLPNPVPVPGIKLGLANVAVVFALYKLGYWQAGVVSIIRVALSALLFGSALSLIYSLTGAVLSLGIMILSKKVLKLHTVGVSVLGGVVHNAGQIAVASIIMETAVIIYYMPWLIFSGTVAGIAIGLTAYQLIKRIKI